MSKVNKIIQDYKDGKYRVEYIFGDAVLVNNVTNEHFIPDDEEEEYYTKLDEVLGLN
jgi:hypothetical protein